MMVLPVAKKHLAFWEEEIYFCNPREDIAKCVNASYLMKRDVRNTVSFKDEKFNNELPEAAIMIKHLSKRDRKESNIYWVKCVSL